MNSNIFIILLVICVVNANDSCCPRRQVEDSPVSDLNGVYILKAKEDVVPLDNCVDACVYEKVGDEGEYCFMDVRLSEAATVKCSDSTSSTTSSTISTESISTTKAFSTTSASTTDQWSTTPSIQSSSKSSSSS